MPEEATVVLPEGEGVKKVDKKEARIQARLAQENAKAAELEKVCHDIEADWFGYLPLIQGQIRTTREWTEVRDLDASLEGKDVWVRARLQEQRAQGSLCFIILRSSFCTVQTVLSAKGDAKPALRWAGSIPKESIVDIFGTVTIPEIPVDAPTQKVELQIKKIFCVSKAAPELPFQLHDANRPDVPEGEVEDEKAAAIIRVNQDVRLDNRIIDLRTVANQALMRIKGSVCALFREYLSSQQFTEIQSPKLIGGASEGGANVFNLQYFGRDACLAQSPQLYKQMALTGDMDRVFEVGPVFRAENSHTHRHLCEFTGLDFEMTIKESYHEVLNMVSSLFKFIFNGLNERCQREIQLVYKQHPNRSFDWIENTPMIDFEDGMAMLRAAGRTDIPDDLSEFDMGTEQEKFLGVLVKEKYKTDFYMLIKYPLGVRPFYTMPADEKLMWSNSYDVFMRGEEIISGAQRVHDPDLLKQRAEAKGIPVHTIQPYIDAFKYGSFPHGGAGVGLERVVMLFLGLNNIRKISMFPRDPKRIAP